METLQLSKTLSVDQLSDYLTFLVVICNSWETSIDKNAKKCLFNKLHFKELYCYKI